MAKHEVNMAGDWIKWTKGFAWKPEVLAIAKELDMDRLSVAATLMELWEWADDITDDGNAHSVTTDAIDGKTRVQGLSSAMQKAGWLIIGNDGVIFPKFERHNGNSAKKRAQNGRRVRRHRM
jgi:hypothetical protein